MASGPYYSGAQSSRDFPANSSTRPSDSSFDSTASPNRISQPWVSSNEQSFPSGAGYHPGSSQPYYDAQPDARMQQLPSPGQSTAFGITQVPSFGGQRDLPMPQNPCYAVPHSGSGPNNSYTPFSEPQNGWDNARANPTPFRSNDPVLPSPANVFYDYSDAMVPHGVPSCLLPYSINSPTPTNHIYPPSSSGHAPNPIWRRGRDEAAIADRRKADAQVYCPDPSCRANFTTKGACKKHWESKHQGRRFRCFVEGCEKEYADESSLGRHIRLNHSDTRT